MADEEININNNGTEILVHCDHTTEGGGWTRILDISETYTAIAFYIPIDDLGLSYT